jgi:hypothetical protein
VSSALPLLTGSGIVLAGLLPVAYVRLRARRDARSSQPSDIRPPWSAFLWGALAWLLGGLIAKAIAAHFMKNLLEHSTGPRQWLALGLLTGVFECALVLGFAALVPSLRRRATWPRALAFGVGFGAAEALLLSIDAFLPETPFDAASPAEAVVAVVLPIVERLSATAIHAFACALILLTLRTRRQPPFWIALVYKSLVDGVPTEKLQPLGILAIESVYVLFGIVALIGLLKLRKTWPPDAARATRP